MKIKDCARLLKKLDKIHIYTHIHPDGDTLGSSYALAYALKKIGKRVKVVCLDTLPYYLSFIWNVENDDFEPEHIITADVADTTLLGDFGDKKIKLVIDHHLNNNVVSENKLCIPEMAATGEIIYELIKALKIKPDKYIAECLYTAIATDTGCFKFSNANSHTFATVSELTKYTENGNFGYLNAPLFITKSIDKMKFESDIISNLKFYFGGKVSVAVVTDELIAKHNLSSSDTGGIEQLGKSPEGVELAITLKERSDGFKVSMRSSDNLDCSAICASFGGGGHRAASGCFFSEDSDTIINTLISYVKEKGIL